MSEAKNGRHVEENGEIRWYKNDILHRTDGPAIEYPDGSQAWFSNGVRHRSGEPAYVGADGSEEWWVRGVNIGNRYLSSRNSSSCSIWIAKNPQRVPSQWHAP